MKITKIIMVVGVISLLVAGTALAWGGSGRNSNLTYEERQEIRANYGCTYNGEQISQIDIIADITGKSVDEVRDLCLELRDDDKNIGDYLKEQGLYEEFKTKAVANYEEKINDAVENERIDEDKAKDLIEQYEENLDNGTVFNGPKSGYMRGQMQTGKGLGRGGRGCRNFNTGKTF